MAMAWGCCLLHATRTAGDGDDVVHEAVLVQQVEQAPAVDEPVQTPFSLILTNGPAQVFEVGDHRAAPVVQA